MEMPDRFKAVVLVGPGLMKWLGYDGEDSTQVLLKQ
jgi:hypothetical protein